MEIKTVEELRTAFPGLIAKIIKEEQAGMLKTVEDAKNKITEDTIASMKDKEIKEAVVFSKEDGVTCPNCESHIANVDVSTMESEITTLKEDTAKDKEKIKSLEKENALMKKKEEELDVRSFITDSLKDEKHNRYREALVKKIGTPESKEAAKKMIESEITFITAVIPGNTGASNLSGIPGGETTEANKDMATLAGADD